MDRLYAPWRSSYVTSSGDEGGCVLCGIGQDKDRDSENYVLHRRGDIYVVLNRYPYINGHLMIVPLRHVPSMEDLTEAERCAMWELAAESEGALIRGMNCMGINGGWNMGSCAGAGIEGHLHIHMLPRWNGDTNFMTTACNTRVISASLDDSYRRLRGFFQDRGGG